MGHEFTKGTGFFVQEPSWHRLENVVLEDWPGSWAEAREHAKLEWEPEIVRAATVDGDPSEGGFTLALQPDWQGIRRNDNRKLLCFQPITYAVINNAEFGKFIEIVMGSTKVQYEGLFELRGGKEVCCLVRFPEVRSVPGDPSEYYTYVGFRNRHDGRGGMSATCTNVRWVCKNTGDLMDLGAKEGKNSWSIVHRENWGDKIEDVAAQMQSLFEGQEPYYDMASQLVSSPLSDWRDHQPANPLFNSVGAAAPGSALGHRNSVKDVIRRYLPIGDDMAPRQVANRELERQVVEDVYYGPSCEGIRGTYWGVYNAFTEWVDHGRKYRTIESYTDRQLSPSPIKRRALRITRKMAGV